ncbi:hypothetical protein LO763_13210 [Glycomyces sp. A-F 0318]|uniref:hypothetical protein n=1 Tax=Glycomyces amatae TaxID=2881355 RepID=UPI001E38B02F|nr:hypothetical protein [Glycomyces amatae]MCD0444580.1 hypothetical protein [Glycomyces amatae]
MANREFQPQVSASPESPYPVVTGKRPDRIGPGEGVLEVALHSAARAEGEGSARGRGPGPGEVLRYPVPGTPVLLVDARPVAQGVGTVWVRLPPGAHRVSVQAGGFAGWWTADVAAGRVTALEAHPDRAWTPVAGLPLAPERFAETVRYWTIVWYLPAAFAGALLLLAVPGCLLGALAPGLLGTGTGRTVGYGVFTALALALFAVMAVRHLGSMRLTKRHLRFQAEAARIPVPGAVPARPLALHADRIGPVDPGTGGLLLDLTWEVVWQRIEADAAIDWLWMQYSGEPGPLERRPWMPPPTVAIDGAAVGLDWGRWWIPLAEGAHRIEVSVPRSTPDPEGDGGGRRATWQGTVDVAPGWYVHGRLDARVVQRTGADRARYRATGFAAALGTHLVEGRLPAFRGRRLETEPLDGQTDPRMRHSVTPNTG